MNELSKENNHNDLHFKWVWKSLKEEEKGLILKFWEAEDAVNEDLMLERLEQVCMYVTVKDTNEIIGISSAFEHYNEHLESYFYNLRGYVCAPYRTKGIAMDLIMKVKNQFESLFTEDSHVIGVFAEIENAWVKENLNFGVSEQGKDVYIGKNQKGDHCRVYYFPGAKLFTKPKKSINQN